jgi:hypothetical protein
MSLRRYLRLLAVTAGVLLSGAAASAQFRDQAFSQQYNDDPASAVDTTDRIFSLKEYVAGLKHQQEIKIGTMFMGSAVLVGGCQIYNRDYWKLPIVYTAVGGSLGAGIYLNTHGNHNAAKWCFVGAGVAYWGTLMDGVVSYQPAEYPHAGKATLYSLLVPGLGQIYNREYWKLPLYLGAMGFGIHYYSDCARNFERFRSIYKEATESSATYTGPITADQALYYRNIYRRYRDYALLAVAAIYLLQVMDANVFSYMHNFEVDDDISMRMEPTVMMPDMQLASTGGGYPAVGLRLGVNF